jgi:predicted ABC-type transport system involved in lysophospholipase L1 biosynthesis ATPase subunit
VDPELVALWEYSMELRAEVVKPLEEMVTTLEGLGLGSGEGDIVAICTGVEAVVSSLAEVQQGLDQIGQPPVDDEDLQLAYDELNLAVDDLEQGFVLLQSACQTMNLGALAEAAVYLESGATHMENAAAAIERWEEKVGL